MAEKAPTEQIKADWLKIAETWLQMATEKAAVRSVEVVMLTVVSDSQNQPDPIASPKVAS
jgi:hypothetical protein